MVKSIVAVLFGMLLQLGLTGLRGVWKAIEPAAQQLREAVVASEAEPQGAAVPVAATPGPAGEVEGPLWFSTFGCGPVGLAGSSVILGAAAEALGMTPEALRLEIAEGRTLGEVADSQGVSREALVEAIRTAALEAYRNRLDEAVAAGRLTQDEADERLARFAEQDFAAWLDRSYFPALPHFGIGPFGGELPFDLPGDVPGDEGGFSFGFEFDTDGELPFAFSFGSGSDSFRQAAAEALGITPEELAERLKAGETLAEIAAAEGVPQEDVEAAVREALLDEARAQLDEAVADGRMSRERADKILEEIGEMIHLHLFADPRRLPLPEGWPDPLLDDGHLPRWFLELAPERSVD